MTLLNKRNENGSINLLKVNGKNIGQIISPLHPEFRSQIEDGMWDLISYLVENGYYPVDSCEGHWETDDYSHFTVAFPDLETLYNFYKKIESLPGLCIMTYGTWLDISDEFKFINEMYLANHTNYYFLNVKILPQYNKYIRLLTPLIRKIILLKLKW